jgi:tRNA-2-methylthio-N6-dimethylallyladenosine synthase
MRRLAAVVERSALARHEARIGKVEEVLVEGPSKKDAAMTTGRTRQNKLVHFPAPAPGLRPGSFAEVTVDSAAPHFLRGTFLRQTAEAARRVRIPVVAS